MSIKTRRRLVSIPVVHGFDDFRGSGLIRVLMRTKDYFPEFALYPRSSPHILIESLKDAGFKEEQKDKWVLRTNKFSIFVFTLTGR